MIQRPRRRGAAKHVSTVGSLLYGLLLVYLLDHSVLHLLGVAG